MDVSLLIHYEAVDEATTDMLAAARAGAWQRVIEIEAECLAVTARLRQAQAKGAILAATDLPRRSRLMQQLVLREAEIRRLIHAWCEQAEPAAAKRPSLQH